MQMAGHGRSFGFALAGRAAICMLVMASHVDHGSVLRRGECHNDPRRAASAAHGTQAATPCQAAGGLNFRRRGLTSAFLAGSRARRNVCGMHIKCSTSKEE